jgi:hypothetical protein
MTQHLQGDTKWHGSPIDRQMPLTPDCPAKRLAADLERQVCGVCSVGSLWNRLTPLLLGVFSTRSKTEMLHTPLLQRRGLGNYGGELRHVTALRISLFATSLKQVSCSWSSPRLSLPTRRLFIWFTDQFADSGSFGHEGCCGNFHDSYALID